jgi:hypothetical protein
MQFSRIQLSRRRYGFVDLAHNANDCCPCASACGIWTRPSNATASAPALLTRASSNRAVQAERYARTADPAMQMPGHVSFRVTYLLSGFFADV